MILRRNVNRMKRGSEMRQKKEKKQSKRKRLIFHFNVHFYCLSLFSAIIIQLGKVQIIDGETYRNEVNKKM